MRPDVVVVLFPCVDCGSGLGDAGEPVEIETVLPELAVKALDKRILGWLSKLDEVEFHAALLRPKEHRLAGQLWAIVADDFVRHL